MLSLYYINLYTLLYLINILVKQKLDIKAILYLLREAILPFVSQKEFDNPV